MTNIFKEQIEPTSAEVDLIEDKAAGLWVESQDELRLRQAMEEAYGHADGTDLQVELARGVKEAVRILNRQEEK